MREILFRGKNYSGKWVYGYLVHGAEIEGNKIPGYYIIEDNFSVVDAGEFYHSLSKVTCIGQWTGLCDKNGQKIFEGDILVYPDDEEGPAYAAIFYHDGCFNRGDRYPINQDSIDEEIVCGNIYDNPEFNGKWKKFF